MARPSVTPPPSDALLDPLRMNTLKHWGQPPGERPTHQMKHEATVDCGWGRLIFGQTFEQAERLAEALRAEEPGRRDVGLYIRDPHVVIAAAPQSLFLDPSHTYRLPLQDNPLDTPPAAGQAWQIREAVHGDETALERIYRSRHMVPLRDGYLDELQHLPAVTLLVAEDANTHRLLGAVTGVDHVLAFGDPDHGASLWSLAVDPQCPHPGIGLALVATLATRFRDLRRTYLDLSVMHDNAEAIALYERLGFERVPVYCVKHKNPINEKLFVGPDETAGLNVYARILVNEARRRGISIEVIDAEHGYFRLSFGGRSFVCRESLTELTTAIAMSRCDDKRVTRNVLTAAGLRMPEQISMPVDQPASKVVAGFLAKHDSVVVKPARGEQGHGVQVDLRTKAEVEHAIENARRYCDDVIVEERVTGEDLRVIVIDYKVVAAAVRRPAEITGDGAQTIETLIEKQSRRRAAATDGESRIPLDGETRRCVEAAGYTMDTVLPAGTRLMVRKTANLHTGGTITDVTPQLSDTLREVSEQAARALEIPVTGLDLMVPDPAGDEYAIIEANERPGLANHEPQPTAECFIDLLFPHSRSTA
ncbi:MAG: N-acetylglutaminylglutamine synthetase [Gammaproteobacteria bacterium]|nr:N-acetylglutaminylglutamine synthetase [Gammaproteobacteria bacterium]MBU1414198.1 N-acetylglutaminylglutamine synthetase [Gammaproteobacteria bacterium]